MNGDGIHADLVCEVLPPVQRRLSRNGAAMLSFMVAVLDPRHQGRPQRLRALVFGPLVEQAEPVLHVGDIVHLAGRLGHMQYDDGCSLELRVASIDNIQEG